MTSHQTRPVVLIAEELSPATVEALGPDFEIRHCNGAAHKRTVHYGVDVRENDRDVIETIHEWRMVFPAHSIVDCEPG